FVNASGFGSSLPSDLQFAQSFISIGSSSPNQLVTGKPLLFLFSCCCLLPGLRALGAISLALFASLTSC
ncbi:hypothetical protein PR002_g27723, partial [Phytophthora rubi]